MPLKLTLVLVASAIISYLLGSLNSPIIVVKLLKGEDVREHGSRNAGLTNTLRCYGKGIGLLALIGDLGKGIVAVLICRVILTHAVPDIPFTGFIGYFCGIFAIIGHILPLYYGFRGGKGVLVSSSILLVVDPLSFAIIIPFFLLMCYLTRYVSVSSVTAASLYPFLTFAVQYYIHGWELKWVLLDSLLVLVSSCIMIFMHRENFKRLKLGTENRIGQKK